MKVKELIEILKKQDENLDVEMEIVYEDDNSESYPIDGTYEDKFIEYDGTNETEEFQFKKVFTLIYNINKD